MRDRARAKGVNSYEAGKGHREVERKRPGGQLNVTHEDKIQRRIRLSVTHAPVHTHAHAHTQCGSRAGHRVEGRLAVADHTVLFIMSFSTQAFNSGRAEVGGQASPGMQGLGFSGSNLPPAASGRVGVLAESSARTFPNRLWQFSPESTCRGPWHPATGRADTAAWTLTGPRQAQKPTDHGTEWLSWLGVS